MNKLRFYTNFFNLCYCYLLGGTFWNSIKRCAGYVTSAVSYSRRTTRSVRMTDIYIEQRQSYRLIYT